MLSLDALPLAASASNLLAAREQMAFTLGFHIVLSCLGVALPATILVANYIGLKKGDKDAMELARRWSKAMAVTFAVGAVTGTVLSFEFGLLWPNFMDRFGAAFGIAFAIEGIFFFLEAIFLAIYIYGWKRLSGWAHFWSGVPMFVTGIGGAFAVVAANSWMNQPQGFTLDAAGKVVDVGAAEGPLQHGDRLRGAAHDPRRLHGHRLPGRLDLRGRDAERAARPPAPAGAADPADDRLHRHPDPALRRRHRRARSRRPPAGQVRRHGVHPGNRRPPDRVRRRHLHLRRGQVGDPDPRPRLLPGRLQRRHQGDRPERHPGRRTAAGQHHAAPRLRRDGRDRQRRCCCSAPGSAGSGGKSARSRRRPGSCARSRSPAPARSWRSGAAGS